MPLKYIIFEQPDCVPTLRIFDGITSHDAVMREVGQPVKSAGWLYATTEGLVATTGSRSLAIKSNPEQSAEDTALIKRFYEII